MPRGEKKMWGGYNKKKFIYNRLLAKTLNLASNHLKSIIKYLCERLHGVANVYMHRERESERKRKSELDSDSIDKNGGAKITIIKIKA